jgi:hypothetical protein
MIAPLVAGALFCATPKLDNKTNKWVQEDQETLLTVQKEACKKADPNQPCLYVFTKVDEGKYEATCGPEQRRNDD